MKDPVYHHILSLQCIHVGCFAYNGNILNTAFPIQYYNTKYRDPSKRNVTAHSVITTTPIAFMFSSLLSILNVLSIYVNDKQLLSKMYIEGALVSKCCNIAFKSL